MYSNATCSSVTWHLGIVICNMVIVWTPLAKLLFTYKLGVPV